jgi:hypothetical protein
MPPEKAQRYMAKVVAPLSATQNYLTHIWANFLSTKNFLRPLRFSAAYFPVWVVNAEIEADVTNGDVQVNHLLKVLILHNDFIISARALLSSEIGTQHSCVSRCSSHFDLQRSYIPGKV